MSYILIIDDNPGVCTALKVLLEYHQFFVDVCYTPDEALEQLKHHSYQLVIQDMNFTEDTTSGEEGRVLYHKIRDWDPDLPVILLTAWAQLETAVELVKAGAADYLAKPWDDDKLITTIKNLVELYDLRIKKREQEEQTRFSIEKLKRENDLCGIVFESPKMLEVLTMATQVAKADVSVLITGPNGSGKEKIAEIIQANSLLKKKAFVKVNVGALPLELMEAELFGAESGAYTGITKKRSGRFESANGGTLFLDEIGNLPLAGQMKLLRVLQTGEYQSLGSDVTKNSNIRLISATNSDLLKEIQLGNFREDLYYRINVIQMTIPPLVDRKEDILPLVNFFIGPERSLSSDAKNKLLQYSWPGNVRELQNLSQRACVLAKKQQLEMKDFGFNTDDKSVNVVSKNINKEEILKALMESNGVIARAAKKLGLSRQALYRRMEKFGIEKSS